MVIWKGPERIKIGRCLNFKSKDIGDSVFYSPVILIFIFRKIIELINKLMGGIWLAMNKSSQIGLVFSLLI